ncbi:cupredoxin domain-containing protein [Paenibacillus sp. KQZ6P-2]|uniref:Cupredoxin domain-containing protein n=1 Tax=Paenibacillus mangrovi TaxID=2931978 RepID=A0A9X1WM37_9BACL|nr:cupredoxin domain-containing protein [Paenibacillus mangrovi]MCJ8011166.1 cupredoxin domain-containing protein [Paenibacillus mangrovi]
MKKNLFSLIAVAALSASVLAGCGNSGSSSASDSSTSAGDYTTEVTVNAKSFEFSPSEIKVKKGDKVKLTLKNTDGAHGLEIPEFNVNLQKNGSVIFEADKAGTFDFDCSVMCGAGHSNMKGKLIVE